MQREAVRGFEAFRPKIARLFSERFIDVATSAETAAELSAVLALATTAVSITKIVVFPPCEDGHIDHSKSSSLVFDWESMDASHESGLAVTALVMPILSALLVYFLVSFINQREQLKRSEGS